MEDLAYENCWYDIVGETEELKQGDFVDDCEFIVPEYVLVDPSRRPSHKLQIHDKNYDTPFEIYDVVVISQSCDLANEKISNVLVCPRFSYKYLGETDERYKKPDKLELIRQGKEYRFYMLDESKYEELAYDIQVVDFNTVFTVPLESMKEMAKLHKKRLRLRSPYKEKLAQAFAYCHMRIGLPHDIAKFGAKALAHPDTSIIKQR